MKLIRRTDHCSALAGGSVVTIGNYDGVHLGHQAILEQVVSAGREEGLATCVLTFEPMPSEFFNVDKSPGRLSTWQERYRLIRRAGVDVLYLMPFNLSVANLSAEEFVHQQLIDLLRTKILYVGDDFRFGKGRSGDPVLLEQMGHQLGYTLRQLSTVEHQSQRISSSAVRACLLEGRLADVSSLLGRRYSMSGRVVHGQQLGRTLGFPTANIKPRRNSLPMTGIFAVRVKIRGHAEWLNGVANLGFRPTVGGGDALLEAFIFDFDGDLYGQYLTVEFIEKLREEEHFDQIEQMVTEMHRDVDLARAILTKIDS